MNPPKVILLKQDRIDYIINGVCEYYNIPKDEFCVKYARGERRFRPKKMAMVLLCDIGDCSLKDIAFALKYDKATQLTNVHRYVQSFREDISFDKEIKKDYNSILKKLGVWKESLSA